jgi:undecaprenyl-diphosphatase
MAFTTNHRTDMDRAGFFPVRSSGLAVGTALAHVLDQGAKIDLVAVRIVSDVARRPAARHLAIAISRLGNGWIYPILIVMVLFAAGWRGAPAIGVGAFNAALLHVVYPFLKKYFRRQRPFLIDPQLSPLLPTLDEHSFPSGHAMTIVGVLTPLVIAWPAMLLLAVAMTVAMAWSRVATAHHFPSDVVAGLVLGIGLAYPLSKFALAFV